MIKRQPISDNDIPDIIQRFHQLEKEAERQRTDQSFFVPVDEIRIMIMIYLSIIQRNRAMKKLSMNQQKSF